MHSSFHSTSFSVKYRRLKVSETHRKCSHCVLGVCISDVINKACMCGKHIKYVTNQLVMPYGENKKVGLIVSVLQGADINNQL